MAAEIEAARARRARRSIAAGRSSFIATLFAIHIGRMGTDGTLLGLISPGVAVLGDMFIAVIFDAARDQSAVSDVARTDALDRAPRLALAPRRISGRSA